MAYSRSYWEYFLALDSDLETVGRYVEFDPANYHAFSIEFVRLILAACSEVDVVAKLLCESIDATKPRKNINHYRSTILGKYQYFHMTDITVPRYGLRFTPWGVWGGNTNPGWWDDYNKVKHERSANFSKANLFNATISVAGLFVMVLYYNQHELGSTHVEPILGLLSMAQGTEPIYSGAYVLPDPPSC